MSQAGVLDGTYLVFGPDVSPVTGIQQLRGKPDGGGGERGDPETDGR